MFSGREFWGVLFKTFYFMGAFVLGSVVLGLAIAVLLNRRLRGRNFVRSPLYLVKGNRNLEASGA